MATTKRTIWIQQEHIEFIWKECHFWFPKETGGLLMGFVSDSNFWITNIVGPGPKAKHESYSYTPDNDFHEDEMARIYHASGRTHTYLGDWHTHPNNGAYLSNRDKKTLKNISENELCRLPKPLMLILSTKPIEFKAWIYAPRAIISCPTVQMNFTK